jgi:succinate dehydrogenase / fumarate reductase, cytochrome b subunit
MKNVKNLNPLVGRDVGAMTRDLIARNPVLALWRTMIGKKVVMAVTGVVFVAFVIVHMLGNLKMFSGPSEINAYSRFLREVGSPAPGYGQLLWLVRIILLVCMTLHVTAAIQLTRMSWAARPVTYAVKRDIETTFDARLMRWGGVLLLAFVIFHLLHLTGGVVGFEAGQFKYFDVYQNVVTAFSSWPVVLFYIVAMGALCLHLSHGIWSLLQTLGWNTARNAATLKVLSRAIAILVFWVHLGSGRGRPRRAVCQGIRRISRYSIVWRRAGPTNFLRTRSDRTAAAAWGLSGAGRAGGSRHGDNAYPKGAARRCDRQARRRVVAMMATVAAVAMIRSMSFTGVCSGFV